MDAGQKLSTTLRQCFSIQPFCTGPFAEKRATFNGKGGMGIAKSSGIRILGIKTLHSSLVAGDMIFYDAA